MEETFTKLDGDQFLGLVAIVAGIAAGVVVTLALVITPYWRRVRQTDAETQLKRDLVAAGFSADDVERVVRATAAGTRPRKAGCCGRAGQLSAA